MVADGYKDTEIGVIPDEWDVKQLENIFEITAGKSKSNSIINNGKYVLIDMGGINQHGQIVEKKYLNIESDFIFEKELVMPKDDIGGGQIIGKVVYIPENNKYILGDHVFKLSLKRDYNSKYFYYLINSSLVNKTFRKKATGTAQLGLSRKSVSEQPLIVPPLKEQEKIADILSTADDKIDAIASQIEKTEILKKGLLQKLLSEGIGHSEFKDSELGKIPASWEVVELKSIIKDLVGGVSVNSEDRQKLEEEYGILKTSAIQNGSFLPDKHKTILNTEISRATTNPLADHIIFSRMNTPDLVGQSGYVDKTLKDLFLPDRLWQLDVKDRDIIFVKWLSFILVSSDTSNMIKKSATGTSNSMKNISKPSLLKIKIALPPLEEQKQISEILSTADEKLEVLRAKKERYETLKKGLLQKLLSGEVRV